jgi:tol-pal system-associated acyl-CoA thioesterase
METGRADQPADQPPGGRFDGALHRLPIRVYFEDTDLSGVVYHANYLRYMERARSDMLRLAGVDQRAAHEAGEGAYAVASLAIRYRAPAKLDDALVVVTRVTDDAPRASPFIKESCVARLCWPTRMSSLRWLHHRGDHVGNRVTGSIVSPLLSKMG